MTYFEIKKIFSRTFSKIILLMIFGLLCLASYFTVQGVSYVNGEGETEYGYHAIQKLREEQKKWAGELTTERLQSVILENNRIASLEEYNSRNLQDNEIAYSLRQGINGIRDLLILAYCDFEAYDYYRPDSLSSDDAENFYSNRISGLKNWLGTQGAKWFSQEEKDFLTVKYEAWEPPLTYNYSMGWTQISEMASMVIMPLILMLGLLLAGVFPSEFSQKSDSVFFSSYYGRNRAVLAKIKAAFLTITTVYWVTILIFTSIVLGFLGTDGAGCMIQSNPDGWKSFYNITNFQEYLLIVICGYIGALFILLVTMLVSAKTRSALPAAVTPFIIIFLPSLLTDNILGLLPDQLLQINMLIDSFQLYHIGPKIVGVVQLLPFLYLCAFVLLIPLLYQLYRRSQLR